MKEEEKKNKDFKSNSVKVAEEKSKINAINAAFFADMSDFEDDEDEEDEDAIQFKNNMMCCCK